MTESSLLETTAEVAVAFAGFISIFLVLAAREGRFPAGDSLTIRVIVAYSVGPVFYSVLPLVLHNLGLSGAAIWRPSSAVAILLGAFGAAYILRYRGTVPPAERYPPLSLQNLASWLFFALSFSLHLGNVLAWPWAPSGGVYLAAVWSLIAIAGIQFVELIYRKVL